MNETLTKLQSKWNLFIQSNSGNKILKGIRILFLICILGYLGYKLYQIGLEAVINDLPTQPLFYVFFLLLYFSLPVTEIFIYKIFWDFNPFKTFLILIKKKVLNTDVLGYSGEVFFWNWARKHIDQTEIQLAETIRDNNILSSLASTTVTILLLIIFMEKCQAQIVNYIEKFDLRYLLIGGILLVIIIPILLRFKDYIFATPLNKAFQVYGLQLIRMAVGQIFQIAQWSVVLPFVPFSTWITYASLAILLARIPFPSNKQLIFMGIGVGLASNLGIPEASMFSLLGTIVALNKIFNFTFYFLISITIPSEKQIPIKLFQIENKELSSSKKDQSIASSESEHPF